MITNFCTQSKECLQIVLDRIDGRMVVLRVANVVGRIIVHGIAACEHAKNR